METLQRLSIILFKAYFASSVINLIFAAGYLFARRGRRSDVPIQESDKVEEELGYVRDEIEKTRNEVTKLLRLENLDWSPPRLNSRHQEPGRWERLKKNFSRPFHRNRTAEETQEINTLAASLKELKQEIKEIRRNIENLARKPGPKKIVTVSPLTPPEIIRNKHIEPSVDLGWYPGAQYGDTAPPFDDFSPSDSKPVPTEPILGRPLARDDIAAEIIDRYNQAVTDAFEREKFREQYQPLRVGTVNAVERRQNPTLVAEFRGTTDGDFFAFPIPGKSEYAVVPRLGLTIEVVSYSAGAVGEVFGKTQDHNPALFYSRYRVLQPAIFERKGERWELRVPGKLDLGPGD